MPRPKLKPCKGVTPLKDGRYLVRYVDQFGADHKEVMAGLEEALNRKREVVEAIRRGERPWMERKDKPVLFDEIVKDKLDDMRAKGKKSADRYETTLAMFCMKEFSGRPVDLITPRVIEDFLKTFQKAEGKFKAAGLEGRTRQGSTLNRYRAFLSGCFKVAVKNGKAKYNPISQVDRRDENKPRDVYLEKPHEAAILDKCPGWLRPIAVFGFDTGGRESEIIGIRWEDVDLERGEIRFPETKNDEPRSIGMTERVRSILNQLQNGGRVLSMLGPRRYGNLQPVVPSLPAGRIFLAKREAVSRAFARAAKDAGFPDFHFHDTRHVCATRLAELGFPQKAIQEWLGHKTPSITARYINFAKARGIKQNMARALSGEKAPPIPAKVGFSAPTGSLPEVEKMVSGMLSNPLILQGRSGGMADARDLKSRGS